MKMPKQAGTKKEMNYYKVKKEETSQNVERVSEVVNLSLQL